MTKEDTGCFVIEVTGGGVQLILVGVLGTEVVSGPAGVDSRDKSIIHKLWAAGR